ncbi:sigma-70 family RNA polymerase sigma factor [Geomonas sp. Red32]|uniref:sigma-70 family RNA polymerase sigma factor n=1 Tax=Geomonas sp. Red32 TaxID=2912856 RepID=UPI00202CDB3D|nr:sigma-70 family RNA polymerase sigma factor [Geomonas sp. Red32]
MRLFQFGTTTDSEPASPPQTSAGYAALITGNLSYIEKQCRRAVMGHGDGDVSQENEVDELLNEVLDRLRGDDFKALREFKGKAKLTTYITTIISNLIIDLVRSKKGRSRAKERAREMGPVAERLYELVYQGGCSLHEASAHLEHTHAIHEPLPSLQSMLDRMRGREKNLSVVADGEAAWMVPGKAMVVDEAVEIVVTDPRKTAEATMISGQKESAARETVAGLLTDLSGEDRLILRLRFPDDEEVEPKSVREIAQLLDLTEKSVDARVRRMLLRFKETLLSRGLKASDFLGE